MRKLKITEMNRLEREAYASCMKTPVVVVLDNVRSMNNVGSVFRTADAFRLEGLMLCGITARPPHTDIHKTALGAEDIVPWRYFATTLEAIEILRAEGYEIYALEQTHESQSLEQFMPDTERRYALVIGNEVKGVEQAVVDRCDGCIEIPQFGTKHSLNVSVATGIALWSFVRPWLPLLEQN